MRRIRSIFPGQPQYGLDPAKTEQFARDPRTFSLGAVFGTIPIQQVPLNDWFVGERDRYLKDQFDSDMCTGFGVSYANDDQEKVTTSPEFQFMAGKMVSGNWQGWGNDFESVLKGAVTVGALELEQIPAGYDLKHKSRDFLANPTNWPGFAKTEASAHRKQSYFKVTGGLDKFDNIRAAMWQFRDYRRSVVTGTMWDGSWNSPSKGGLIPKQATLGASGHLFIFDGQVMVNGEPYLRNPQSYGTRIGNGGYMYWPREAVNRLMLWGPGYMLVDMERSLAEILNRYAGKVVALKGPTAPEIYLIQEGKKRHIMSENVLNALGFRINEGEGGFTIIDQGDLDVIPAGESIEVKDLSEPLRQLFHRNNIVK
ncbi:MAG: hypothetical protein PHI63_04820 [Patescibacteria group bacterium]|nr:hypothetical protein [Patescibacteria group bacterium]